MARPGEDHVDPQSTAGPSSETGPPSETGSVSASRALRLSIRAVSRYGPRETLRLVRSRFAEVRFDRRWHVHTQGYVPVTGGDVGASDGYHYVGTPPDDLRRIFRHLPQRPAGRFVDLGCGKGRALVSAALHGFADLTGVDFLTRFTDEARANLQSFAEATGRGLDVRILTIDAAQYEPTPDDAVYFLFNPFPADVLAAVLDRVETSLASAPRDVLVVYYNPAHGSVLDQRPFWRTVDRLPGRHFPTTFYAPAGSATSSASAKP